MGLISGGDESAYWDEVEHLSVWCTDSNLVFNTTITKELIIDYRKNKTDIQPLTINTDRLERVSDFRFLHVHLGLPERKALQRVVTAIQKIIDCPLPSLIICIALAASNKLRVYLKIHLTPDTLCLNCCPRTDVLRHLKHEQTI